MKLFERRFAMLRTAVLASVLLLTAATAIVIDARRGTDAVVDRIPAPEFTQTNADAWINSPPLRVQALRGKVLLLDVWTFDCWNCYHSFPWLNRVGERYEADGLRIIGIHSPEFERERDPAAVAAKAKQFDLTHPVMIDNDFRYWDALGNQAWPTFYLVDKRGAIRYRYIGETRDGSLQARRIERAVAQLLAEPSP